MLEAIGKADEQKAFTFDLEETIGLKALSGFGVGMRGSTPRPFRANVAPAPRLSFSCVKKKDGGERKSLMYLSGGERPTLCLAASPVSLRALALRKRNKTF